MSFFTREKEFYKTFLHLLLVVALQNVIAYSVNVADNIMLGSYSQAALSGAATVNQIQFMVQQTIVSIANGMIMLNVQYWGKNQLSPVRAVTGIALKVGFAFGLGVTLVTAIFPYQILRMFTSDPEIVEAGVSYLSLIKYTYLIYCLSTVLISALRSVETVNISFYVSVLSLVVNVGINYALIFGNFGCPEMGIRGAAIGTIIARVLEFGIVLAYICFKDKKLKLFSENIFRRNKNLARDYRNVAIPVVVTNVLWSLATPIQTGILGHMSADAIAANSVSTTMFQYLKVIVISEASAASVIIGRTIGSSETHKLRQYTHTLQVLFMALGVTLGIILLAIRGPILSCYSLTPEALTLADQLLGLMVFIFIGMSYQMPAMVGIIQGGGDTKFCMMLNMISTWGIVMPLSFLGAFYWNLSVFWVVFLLNCDQLFKCVPIFIRTNSYRWVRVLTREDAMK